MQKPYHIIAAQDENGYTITIPEYPNDTAHCASADEIIKTGENTVMLARMDPGESVSRMCPKCGKQYTGVPAISRADNQTLICQDCGTREAMDSIGLSKDEQEKILDEIHRRNV